MGLDAKSGRLSLFGLWQYLDPKADVGKTFNIVIVLPFTIETKQPSSLYTPSIDNWKWVNTNITNVAASAVSAHFSGNDTKYSEFEFYGEFVVANTYANSHRGSYTIVLPLNAPVGGLLFPALSPFIWAANATCCTLASETDVYVTFPRSAVNIQFFPAATMGVSSTDPTLDFVQWNMTERAQAYLYFVDQNESSSYEISVILGSLLLGSGLSGFADWLSERSERKTERLETGLEEP